MPRGNLNSCAHRAGLSSFTLRVSGRQAVDVDWVGLRHPPSLLAPRHRKSRSQPCEQPWRREAEAQADPAGVRTRIRTPAVGHVTSVQGLRSRKWPEPQGGRGSPLVVEWRRPDKVSRDGSGGGAANAWGHGLRRQAWPARSNPAPVGNWGAESGRRRGGRPEEPSGTRGRALPDPGWADAASLVSGACEAGRNGRAGRSDASGLFAPWPAL